jgi:hypothetical protein
MDKTEPATDHPQTGQLDSAGRKHGGLALEPRPGAYVAIVLMVVVASFAYSLRMNGIFSCQAAGYGSDRYAAYCQATKYGDYDHGAFWFDLEPEASSAAKNADVLFLGNSRMQFGFSSEAVSHWFSSAAVRYFLLGFSHDANHNFEAPLLDKLGPQAKVYVINSDLFFEEYLSPPVRAVTRDRSAKARYQQKRGWQRIHRALCESVPSICGDEIAFFRSRETGDWLVQGGRLESAPVSYVEGIDQEVLEAYTAAGRKFLSHLPVARECVILTMVPKLGTSSETAEAVASALGLNLVAPRLEGLNTFDGSHLDQQSRERWSAAFIEAADPQIQSCLGKSHDWASGSRTR